MLDELPADCIARVLDYIPYRAGWFAYAHVAPNFARAVYSRPDYWCWRNTMNIHECIRYGALMLFEWHLSSAATAPTRRHCDNLLLSIARCGAAAPACWLPFLRALMQHVPADYDWRGESLKCIAVRAVWVIPYVVDYHCANYARAANAPAAACAPTAAATAHANEDDTTAEITPAEFAEFIEYWSRTRCATTHGEEAAYFNTCTTAQMPPITLVRKICEQELAKPTVHITISARIIAVGSSFLPNTEPIRAHVNAYVLYAWYTSRTLRTIYKNADYERCHKRPPALWCGVVFLREHAHIHNQQLAWGLMAQMSKPPTAAVVFELDSMHLLRRVLQDMTCGQRMRACADMPALALQNCSRANVTALVDENLLQFTLAHMAAIDAMPHAYPAWAPELLADLYMRKCIPTYTTSAFTAITDIISDVCTYAGASICDLIRGVILRADDPLAVMNLTRTHCARSRKRKHSLTHVVQYIDQLYFAT